MLDKIQDTRLPEEVGYLSFLVFCSKVSQLEELLNKLLNVRVASVCDTLRERREGSLIFYKIRSEKLKIKVMLGLKHKILRSQSSVHLKYA